MKTNERTAAIDEARRALREERDKLDVAISELELARDRVAQALRRLRQVVGREE